MQSKRTDDMKSDLMVFVKNDAKKLVKGDDVTKINEGLDKFTKKVNELKSILKDDIKKLVADINKMKPSVPETSIGAPVSHSEAPQAPSKSQYQPAPTPNSEAPKGNVIWNDDNGTQGNTHQKNGSWSLEGNGHAIQIG